MNFIKTEIEGVVIVEPRVFKDPRGYFYESFSEREFVANGINCKFKIKLWRDSRPSLPDWRALPG